jgi:topoisomerase-4 subunit A
MATKAKLKIKKKAHPTDGEVIQDVNLLKFTRENYYNYGMAVLEDRAIPDFRDGNIPVARRILWSAYDMGIRSTAKAVKSARVVGDAMGRFHPHGDSSIYGTLVNMTNGNTPVSLVQGDGNWGSMTEPKAAAMRYTEMRLSKFSDNVMFNRFYTPILEFVPNYDGSMREPLLLPALLPVVLLNGKFGIAPGATSYIPTCTTDSVMKMLKGIYHGEEITAKFLYRALHFTSVSGGIEERPVEKEDRLARLGIFKGTGGTAVLKSKSSFDPKTRTLTIDRFANHWRVEKILEKLLDIEGVQEARDDSKKKQQFATVSVVLKRGLLPKMEKAILRHIENKILTSRENYVMNFTERYIDETGQAQARMKPMSMLTMLTEWVAWRTDLERKACAYWIAEADKQIRRFEVLMLAVDNLDIIFKALKQKFTRDELDAHLAKRLKITLDEARIITEMRVYQLRALEKADLLKQKKEVEAKRTELKARRKDPHKFMATQLDEFKFE